jgi:acyl-CoA thioesterase
MNTDHPLLSLSPLGESRFGLAVENKISVGREGRGFMFGGAGLAACVLAMESAAGRPAIWATAQYLSYARPGSEVTIAVSMPSVGKYTTQARATIHHGDTEILSATAALGEREGMRDQWARMDDVPPPDQCPETRHWSDDGMVGGRFKFRAARGFFADVPPDAVRSDDGRLLVWIRPAEPMAIDRIVLAVIADFLTPAIRNATGRRAGGNSLDNTIRYCGLVPTEWVLCDIAVEAIASGIVHGTMRIFAENGALMAIASQSMILRVRD